MEKQTVACAERMIVVVEELDRRVPLALRRARSLTSDICAFSVFLDDAQEQELRQRWSEMAPEVPLILMRSPNGGIAEPLLEYLMSMESLRIDEPVVTVLLPRLIGANWWGRLLRSDKSKYLEHRLLEEGFQVEVFPIYLKNDHAALAADKALHW